MARKNVYVMEIENSKGEKKIIRIVASNPDLAQKAVQRIMHIPGDKSVIQYVEPVKSNIVDLDNIDLYVPDDFK